MGLYEFKADDAKRFADHVGIRVKTKGDELLFSECPYCRAKKSKEKFAINLKTGKFQCFRASCGLRPL